MTNPGRSHPPRLLPLLALSAILWLVAGTAVVSTDALGMGARFDHLVDRVSLALDPPPDRENPAHHRGRGSSTRDETPGRRHHVPGACHTQTGAPTRRREAAP